MTTFDTPKTPAEFVQTVLRSSIEADRLATENINDRYLLEAHTHTAANGLIAALAMENLRRNAPDIADQLADQLDAIFTTGDIGGPAWRIAKRLGHDPDRWLAEHDERAARRREAAATPTPPAA